jgi:hypothetical protein
MERAVEPFILRYGMKPGPERQVVPNVAYDGESETCISRCDPSFTLTGTVITEARTDPTADEAGDR